LPLEHERDAVDHDVEETAHHEPEHDSGADEQGGGGCEQLECGHLLCSNENAALSAALSPVGDRQGE
jgi:hypothetical protein